MWWDCRGYCVRLLLLQLLRLLWLLHMVLLRKAAKHHLIDLSSPQSQRFQLPRNNTSTSLVNMFYAGGLKALIAICILQITNALKVSAKCCQAAMEQTLLLF